MPLDKHGRRTKPHNNQALELFYKYDSKQKKLRLDVTKKCKSLGKSETYPVG